VRLSNDGPGVYVCDRVNDRLQVFEPSGKFLQEMRGRAAHARQRLGVGHGLSHDAAQKFMYVADGANGRGYVLNRGRRRAGLELRPHRAHGGEFKWVHNIAIDRQGTCTPLKSGFGRRVQKFVLLSF